jgi:hypothetical protein
LAYKRKTNSPAAGDKTEETRQNNNNNNNTRHITHLLSNSPTISSATSPGTWKPRFLSRLACSSPTTGTPGAEQYSASSTSLLDVRPSARTRINLVSLIAWHRPLRDSPWRSLLVSVGITFRTDKESGRGRAPGSLRPLAQSCGGGGRDSAWGGCGSARRQAAYEGGNTRRRGTGACRGDGWGCGGNHAGGGNNIYRASEEEKTRVFHPEVGDCFPIAASFRSVRA